MTNIMVSHKENIDNNNIHELIARYPKTLWIIYNNNINNDNNISYNSHTVTCENEEKWTMKSDGLRRLTH